MISLTVSDYTSTQGKSEQKKPFLRGEGGREGTAIITVQNMPEVLTNSFSYSKRQIFGAYLH